MRHILAVASIVTALAACTSPAEEAARRDAVAREAYREKLRGWFGASERELVSYWGPPTSIYEIDGDRHLTYRSSRILPAGYGRYRMLPCIVTFSLESGAVAQWRFEGGGCH